MKLPEGIRHQPSLQLQKPPHPSGPALSFLQDLTQLFSPATASRQMVVEAKEHSEMIEMTMI